MYEAAQATATKLIAEKQCIDIELENVAREHNVTLAKIKRDFLSKISEKDMQLEKLITENEAMSQRIIELECMKWDAIGGAFEMEWHYRLLAYQQYILCME